MIIKWLGEAQWVRYLQLIIGNKYSQIKHSRIDSDAPQKTFYKINYQHGQGISKGDSSIDDLSPVPTTITIRKKVKTAGEAYIPNPFNATFGPLNPMNRVQSSKKEAKKEISLNFPEKNPFESNYEYNFTPTLPNLEKSESVVDDEPQPLRQIKNQFWEKKSENINKNAFENMIYESRHSKAKSSTSLRKRTHGATK